MKMISLNTWGGRAGAQRLLEFFEANKNDTDIFCLQEIWSAPYENLDGVAAGGKHIDQSQIMTRGLQDISAVLDAYTPYFHPHYLDNYGLLTFVKESIPVSSGGELFVHQFKEYVPVSSEGGDIGNHARNIQYVTFDHNGSPLTVINFHGLWNGKGKSDSPERLAQSEKIIEFIRTIVGSVVLMGDFNLLPETESLALFEKAGLRNLISEYGISSTRTSFYDKPVRFADYAFVSPGIEVVDFKVLPDEVSDHSPLLLEIA